VISVEKLNEQLLGDFDAIVTILEALGITNINPNFTRREIRCSREDGRNPSSIRINVDTLYYRCFSTGEKGSIYTLVMNRKGINFPDALRWVARTLGLSTTELRNAPKRLPFNGFFKKIERQAIEPELDMKSYDKEILRPFNQTYSLMFNRDGIGYDTQNYFGVGYDYSSDRITIPQWDLNGNLVGIMGRLNESDAPKEKRWLPIIPCQRSYTLYGYHFNYPYIQKRGFCFIGESEKFVMQLASMGYRNSLAVCGCDISNIQARHIKALMCKTLIVCFDEGLEEERIIEQAKKLKINNPLFQNKVGYIYDANGDYLPLGSKNSPSDLGIEVFENLVKKKIKWV